MARKQQKSQPVQLLGVCGAFQGQSYPISQGEKVCIGRVEGMCQVVIVFDKITRQHCTVEYSGVAGMYVVTDHSTNGTYVDDRRRLPEKEAKFVPRGTVLSLGTSENRVKLC